MIYSINFEGRTCELQARTLEMVDLTKEGFNADLPTKQMYEAEMKLCIKAAGKDFVEEALGTTNVLKVDTAALTLLFKTVTEAYLKPINDFDKQVALSQMDDEVIEAINKAGKAASNITAMNAKAVDGR